MMNEDKYQKSVGLILTSELTISLSVTCILAEEIDFEISRFHTFQTPWSWPWIG